MESDYQKVDHIHKMYIMFLEDLRWMNYGDK